VSHSRMEAAYLQLLAILSAVVLPILIGSALIAPQVITVAYGPRWQASTSVFRILSLCGIFYSYRALVDSMLQVKGRADLSFYCNALALAVFAAAECVGAKLAGIRGVSMALLLASCALLIPLDFALRWSKIRVAAGPFLAAIGPPVFGVSLMA